MKEHQRLRRTQSAPALLARPVPQDFGSNESEAEGLAEVALDEEGGGLLEIAANLAEDGGFKPPSDEPLEEAERAEGGQKGVPGVSPELTLGDVGVDALAQEIIAVLPPGTILDEAPGGEPSSEVSSDSGPELDENSGEVDPKAVALLKSIEKSNVLAEAALNALSSEEDGGHGLGNSSASEESDVEQPEVLVDDSSSESVVEPREVVVDDSSSESDVEQREVLVDDSSSESVVEPREVVVDDSSSDSNRDEVQLLESSDVEQPPKVRKRKKKSRKRRNRRRPEAEGEPGPEPRTVRSTGATWKKKRSKKHKARKLVGETIDGMGTGFVPGVNGVVGNSLTVGTMPGAVSKAFKRHGGGEDWKTVLEGDKSVSPGTTTKFDSGTTIALDGLEAVGDGKAIWDNARTLWRKGKVLSDPNASTIEREEAWRAYKIANGDLHKHLNSFAKKGGTITGAIAQLANGSSSVISGAAGFAGPLAIAAGLNTTVRSIRKTAKAAKRADKLKALRHGDQALDADLDEAAKYTQQRSRRKAVRQGVTASGAVLGTTASVIGLIGLIAGAAALGAATPVGWVLAGVAAALGLGLMVWKIGSWVVKKFKRGKKRHKARKAMRSDLMGVVRGEGDASPDTLEALGFISVASQDEVFAEIGLNLGDLQAQVEEDPAGVEKQIQKALKGLKPDKKKKERLAGVIVEGLSDPNKQDQAKEVLKAMGIKEKRYRGFDGGDTKQVEALTKLVVAKMGSW